MFVRIIKIVKPKAALFFCLAALFVSCASAPKTPDPVLGGGRIIPLEEGATVYLFVDAKGARPVLDLIPIRELSEKQTRQMLDKTKTAVAGLYPAESGRRFQLVSWGSYPGSAGIALGASKDWKKQRSAGGLPYWFSPLSRISLALNARQAYVAASLSENPGDPFSPGIEVPPDFDEFRRDAVLACWLEKPGDRLNNILGALELPLQIPAERMYISLFRAAHQGASENGKKESAAGQGADAGGFEALVRIETAGSSQAKALVTLISMAKIFASNLGEADGPAVLAAILFANPPVQDGNKLTIKTSALSEKDIALLFSLFSVYSDQII
jgi:hypothetical protein